MTDPVMDADGFTYERSVIEEWIASKGTSPMTRAPLSMADLRPNRAIKNAIEEEKALRSKKDSTNQSAPVIPAPGETPRPLVASSSRPAAAPTEAIPAGASASYAPTNILGTLSVTPVADPAPSRHPSGPDSSASAPVSPAAAALSGGVLRHVETFDGTFLTEVVVCLFTGSNRVLVVNYRDNSVDFPRGIVLRGDRTLLDAACRILREHLQGRCPNLQTIRRYVWNNNTAIFSAWTSDQLPIGYSNTEIRKLNLYGVNVAHAALEGALDWNFFPRAAEDRAQKLLNLVSTLVESCQWQCLVDGGVWVSFSGDIQQSIETARKRGLNRCDIIRKGIPYTLRFDTLKQIRTDGVYNTVRDIRRLDVINYCS